MKKEEKRGRRAYTQEFKLEAVRLVRTGIAKARVARATEMTATKLPLEA